MSAEGLASPNWGHTFKLSQNANGSFQGIFAGAGPYFSIQTSAEIDPADENKRTYRIVKSKGNASSYAADILKKYGLDKDSLRERRDGYGK